MNEKPLLDNDNQTILLFEKYGATWLEDKSDLKHRDKLLSFIKERISKNQRILDICCGYGRIAVPLQRSGFNVYGIDISPDLIKKAIEVSNDSKVGENKFKVANMKSLPFSNEFFNFSYCVWASFNYLNTRADQLIVLEEMHRTLSAKGKALIEVPYHEDKKDIQLYDVGDYSYNYFPFCIEQLEELFNNSNFSKKNISYEKIAGRDRIVAVFTK